MVGIKQDSSLAGFSIEDVFINDILKWCIYSGKCCVV